jgi:hypothetical protein
MGILRLVRSDHEFVILVFVFVGWRLLVLGYLDEYECMDYVVIPGGTYEVSKVDPSLGK